MRKIAFGIIGIALALGAAVCGWRGIARAEDAPKPELTGTIVYTTDRGGNWDIWTMKPDGTELKQLTRDAFMDSDPKFSPDGEQIIFSSMRKGIPELWLIKRDGTGGKKVCEGCQADWNAEGTKILFIRDNQAYLREMKTGKERLVTPPEWERCGFPAWHPDGKRFVVSSRHNDPIGIYIVDLIGKAKPVQVNTGEESCTPRWSKDGKSMLYQSASHIFKIGIDSKNNEQLTFGADIQHYSDFSPDNTQIIYCRAPKGDGPWLMYRMNLADETETQLTTENSSMYPDWSAK